MKIGKHNFTKVAVIQMSVAAVLFLLGVLLGLWAWSDYSLYGDFRTGLRAQASGNMQNALKPLEAAAQARADYPFPAELDAKLKVDAGTPATLEAALRLYSWLSANGHGDRPTVKLGKAAACLRLSDLKPEAEREKWYAEAAKALSGLTWPEAKIIRAHLALRQGKVDAAKKDLEAAYNEARRGQVLVGLDSLADLYVGLGVCAAQDKHYLEASRMFLRANHLVPGARNPLLNSIYLLARRYAETPPPRDELVSTFEPLLRRATNEWKREFSRDPQTYAGMDRAILTFALSVAWGLVKQNEIEPQAFLALSQSTGISESQFDKARVQLTTAAACLAMLKRADLNPGQRSEYRRRAARALDAAGRLIGDNPKLLSRVKYVAAMIEVMEMRDTGGGDRNRVLGLQRTFEQLATEMPDDADVHRSLGAIYLKVGANDNAVGAFEKSLKLDGTSAGQEKVRDLLGKLKAGGPAGEKKE